MGVHNYGTIPGDGFTNGLAGNQEESHFMLLGKDHYLVPVIEQNNRPVTDKWIALNVKVVYSFHFVSERIFLPAEISLAVDYVSEDRMALFRGGSEFCIC